MRFLIVIAAVLAVGASPAFGQGKRVFVLDTNTGTVEARVSQVETKTEALTKRVAELETRLADLTGVQAKAKLADPFCACGPACKCCEACQPKAAAVKAPERSEPANYRIGNGPWITKTELERQLGTGVVTGASAVGGCVGGSCSSAPATTRFRLFR